jgi:LacI family transcriptional regulator
MLNLREEGMSPRRLDQIIKARGIRGLLIPPEPEALFNADLDWSRVAVVATTTTAKPLRLHRALPHNFHNVHLLIDHALACGYKRIGLVHWPLLEERMMQATSAVYALEGFLRKSFQPVPVFEWKWQPPEKLAVALERWVQKSRVDCVLAFDTFALDALAAVGIHAPWDIGYVSYGGAPASVSQINQNPQTVGAAAVDLLSAQVIRGECGFPASPKTLLIEGKFVQGSTTVKPG